MNLEEIAQEDIRRLQGKSGIYWSMGQPDESGEMEVLARRIKNFSTQAMYNLLYFTIASATGTTGTQTIGTMKAGATTASGTVIGAGGGTINAMALGGVQSGAAYAAVLYCYAGTDTTTPTTLSMNALVSAASPTPASSSITLASVTGGLQWTAGWITGSFGATGTTAIGEFGLTINDLSFGTQTAMLNRLAVADNNAGFTSAVNVNNLAPYSAVITLVI